MFWLLTLPVRLLLGLMALVFLPVLVLLVPVALLLWLPFALLKLTLRVAVGIVLVPVMAILAVCGLLVAGIAAAAASLPVLLLGLFAFVIWRLARRPARAW